MLDKFLEKGLLPLIKEHLSIIVLIPTLIGGLWQALELLFIDPSFIRFFSVTQVISDGIALISIFGSFLILLKIAYNHFKKLNTNDTIQKPFSLKNALVWFIIATVFVCYFIYSIYQSKIFEDSGLSSINKGAFIFFLLLFIVPFLIAAIKEIAIETIKYLKFNGTLDSEKIVEDYHNKKGALHSIKVISGYIFVIGSMLVAVILLFLFIQFRNILVYPDKFENLKFVWEKVHRDYGKNVKANILYLNDKYIFVEIIKHTPKELEFKENPVLIYKTDDVLFKK